MSSSSNKGRPAAVWKHFSPVIIEMDNGTLSKTKYKCLVCLKEVTLTPKEGYRHIKNCEVLSNDDKMKIWSKFWKDLEQVFSYSFKDTEQTEVKHYNNTLHHLRMATNEGIREPKTA